VLVANQLIISEPAHALPSMNSVVNGQTTTCEFHKVM